MIDRPPCETRIVVVDPRLGDYAHLFHGVKAPLRLALFARGEDVLQAAPPADMWLIHARLPDMSGCELSAAARRLGARTVFLIADRYDPDDELAALSAGLPFKCKPIDAVWLKQLCREVPQRRQAQRRHRHPLREPRDSQMYAPLVCHQ